MNSVGSKGSSSAPLKESVPTSSASGCCYSSSFSMVSPHISCGAVDLTASQVWSI